MEVAGKWMELSIINTSEVTQTIKVISGCLLCLFSPSLEIRALYFRKQRESPQEGGPHRTSNSSTVILHFLCLELRYMSLIHV